MLTKGIMYFKTLYRNFGKGPRSLSVCFVCLLIMPSFCSGAEFAGGSGGKFNTLNLSSCNNRARRPLPPSFDSIFSSACQLPSSHSRGLCPNLNIQAKKKTCLNPEVRELSALKSFPRR